MFSQLSIVSWFIGASVSGPHTCELNARFLSLVPRPSPNLGLIDTASYQKLEARRPNETRQLVSFSDTNFLVHTLWHHQKRVWTHSLVKLKTVGVCTQDIAVVLAVTSEYRQLECEYLLWLNTEGGRDSASRLICCL